MPLSNTFAREEGYGKENLRPHFYFRRGAGFLFDVFRPIYETNFH